MIAVPLSGVGGWRYLEAFRERHDSVLKKDEKLSRDIDYFTKNISKVDGVDQLLQDQKLFRFSLTAFGLAEDLPNKFFIRKVLEEGTIDENAFANRLADKRYLKLAESFGFDRNPPNTKIESTQNNIVSSFLRQSYETRIGESDAELRLALSFDRLFPELLEKDMSEDAVWFTVLGTESMRRVFESALSIPPSVANLSIDKQLEYFKSKAEARYGTTAPKDFESSALRDSIIEDFLLRSNSQSFLQSGVRGSVALSLLQTSTSSLF